MNNATISAYGDDGASAVYCAVTDDTKPCAVTAPSPIYFDDDCDDVEIIDEIEWAEKEDGKKKKYGELATKPKGEPPGDPCFCTGTSESRCKDLSCLLYACQEECRSNCPVGKYCCNKRIQRRQWKSLEVVDAGSKGKGLKLKEYAAKGEFIVEYVGRAVRKEYLKRLFCNYKQERRLYIMALDTNIYLDARKKGGVARYVNHSCDPNCKVERWKVRGIMRAGVFALRNIRAGEELSFDYQWERQHGRAPTKCYCDSFNCRGTLEKQEECIDEDYDEWYNDEDNWMQPTDHNKNSSKLNLINRTIKFLTQQPASDTLVSRTEEKIIENESTLSKEKNEDKIIQQEREKEQQEQEPTNKEETDTYSLAYVCQYNESTCEHLLLMRGSLQETWKNLSRLKFLILDETNFNGEDDESDLFIIAKKQSTHNKNSRKGQIRNIANASSSSLLGKMLSHEKRLQWESVKHYLYVQTPIKHALYSKHLISRCQNNCRVQIIQKEMARPPLPPNLNSVEEIEKYRALDSSKDGTVWKLTISGSDVPKAYAILTKNVAWLESKLLVKSEALEPLNASSFLPTTTQDGGSSDRLIDSGASLNNTVISKYNTSINCNIDSNASIKTNTQEIVLPRLIVDSVKRRLPALRERFRGKINFSFTHSESKSKQIAKIIFEPSPLIGGNYTNHLIANNNNPNHGHNLLQAAKEQIWSMLFEACLEMKAPISSNGFYYDLGFLGGELDGYQFQHLLSSSNFTPEATEISSSLTDAISPTTTANNAATTIFSIENRHNIHYNQNNHKCCREPKLQASSFIRSFENTFKCKVWVQSVEDSGRIDGSNNIVAEIKSIQCPRKIYFNVGCTKNVTASNLGDSNRKTKEVSRLWDLLQTRAHDIAVNNVRYLYLGSDCIYQPLMMQNDGKFFDYVQHVTGASVEIDSMTGDHLRIDGRSALTAKTIGSKNNPSKIVSVNAAALASELILLQIDLYRDHCIRQQNWVFGRDWTLDYYSSNSNNYGGDINVHNTTNSIISGNSVVNPLRSKQNPESSSKSTFVVPQSQRKLVQFDEKSISNACQEIADIIDELDLGGKVKLHATIIFYRYVSIIENNTTDIAPKKISNRKNGNNNIHVNGIVITGEIKIREVTLVCVFIANKSQKITKWKTLDIVLKAAYAVFYPGAIYDCRKEEVLVLESKVINAEVEVLRVLDYDIFWPGVNRIVMAVKKEKGFPVIGNVGDSHQEKWQNQQKRERSLADAVLDAISSGPVLAAGATIWLKYGVEYIFAAGLSFLLLEMQQQQQQLEHYQEKTTPITIALHHLLRTFSLVPAKVSRAAEIIAGSKKIGSSNSSSSSKSKKKERNNCILIDILPRMKKMLPKIKDICIQGITQDFLSNDSNIGRKSSTLANSLKMLESNQGRFRRTVDHDCNRRVFQNIDRTIVNDRLLQYIDIVRAASKCNIYIEESNNISLSHDNHNLASMADIILEGSWRALAIAEYLLRNYLEKNCSTDINNSSHAINVSFKTMDSNVVPGSQQMDEICHGSGNKVKAKSHPGLLNMNAFQTFDGWEGTVQSEVSNFTSWGKKTGGKSCIAGRIDKSLLRDVGLRWWIPPQYGPSTSGSICDMFTVRSASPNDCNLKALKQLTKSIVGENNSINRFPLLTTTVTSASSEAKINNSNNNIENCDRSSDNSIAIKSNRMDKDGIVIKSSPNLSEERNLFAAVSLQRWPSDKVERREREKFEKQSNMQMGFSAAALQEMQLLTELHSLEPSPQGHPNFALPMGLATSASPVEGHEDFDSNKKNGGISSAKFGGNANTRDSDIFSLFRTSEQNERAAEKNKKWKYRLTSPHLVFQPTPFILQRFMSPRKKRDFDPLISPAILSSWYHDLLSALAHCHTNNVILRSIQPDQIVVDNSGMAKFCGLYRATVIEPMEHSDMDFLKSNLNAKKSNTRLIEDFYTAPENLLGYQKYTKESDVWSMGCLLANLLLNKPLFHARERDQLLNLQLKVIGTIAKDNFEIGCKLPNYSKPIKKYPKGNVGNALKKMIKDKEETRKHAGAIDLLEKMLHLDPRERISAVDALNHNYILGYINDCNSRSFGEKYVIDWVALKERIMKVTQSEEDEEKKRERKQKRKAILIEASERLKNAPMDDDDGLYDMDDLLDATKKKKI